MMRKSLLLSRKIASKAIASRPAPQWPVLPHTTQRAFAKFRSIDQNTKPSIHDSDAVVLPGSQSQTATAPTPPPPGPIAPVSPSIPTPATPSENKTIPPENVPLVPPPPPGGKVQTSPSTSVPPLGPKRNGNPIPPKSPPPIKSEPIIPPPPPPPRKKSGRFRRFLLYLFLFGGFSYAGGVYYSLVSDNFHDFFTEYIPFGEDAVLYFEEREFRKRFPRMTNPTNRPPPRDSGNKITIPSKSGLSWKISEEGDQASDGVAKGRHMSAIGDRKPNSETGTAKQVPSAATPSEKTNTVEQVKKAVSSASSNAQSPSKAPASPPSPAKAPEKSTPKPSPREELTRAPEVNEPSKIMPIARIDPLNIKDADEPLVQDLVKIINDIIIVVNADNASAKYSSTINKAKSELAGVGRKIVALKEAESEVANEKIKSTQSEFDQAARELVRRLEEEMKDQESRWRDDFESEREKISHSYQERLDTEIKRSQQITEQRLRNELLEQAIELEKSFISDVQERVETERDGRLSKLSDLSSSVNELESLTAQWTSVLDANLKSHRLQVAIEAVRSSLYQADRPRPFVHELAALKELASDNPVVNAAISSINPTAYQRGVPTSAQLIDRFRRVAAEVRKASLLPEDAGVAAHALSYVLSQLLFRKKGLAVGDDVESVLTRTETLLEEGNLDEAAREMNGLEGWAKRLSGDWIAEARRVLEVRQAVEVIGAEVRLLGLGLD